jgi:hypothetical protein
MGSGLQVDTNDLSRAALQIGAAAKAVQMADPGSDVVAISRAMKGGNAARKAAVLEERWRRRFQAWARDAVAQERALSQSAHTYRQVEADVAHGLQP